MKVFIYATLFALVFSCATSKKMMLPSGEYGHSVSCDGTALKWDQCFEKAAEICPHGYKRIDKSQNSGAQWNAFTGLNGYAQRNMLIQCKDTNGRAISSKDQR